MKHAGFATLIAAALTACTALPPATPAPTIYLLDGMAAVSPHGGTQTDVLAAPGGTAVSAAGSPRSAGAAAGAMAAQPTLVLAAIQSAAGFDTSRMLYTLGEHRMAAFARNEWADTPARMLDTVLLRALQEAATGWKLVPDSSLATGLVRLELQQLQLLQDFSTQPSTVRLRLRASLVRSADKQVLATRGFDLREPAASDDPAGGVAAANRASQALAAALLSWCQQSLVP